MSNNILNIFDGEDMEGVSALIDKLEKSSFDYMKLEGDGMSIVIGKNGAGEASVISAATLGAAAQPVNAAPVPLMPKQEGKPAATAPEAKQDVPEQEGVYIIRAPSYGLFYAQSEPGAPPYVTLGATITVDDTIGLMEIMKTFTAITSPVAGEIIAIHVKNEETLEPDQPLISVKVS